jgi:acyl-CoA thioesterase
MAFEFDDDTVVSGGGGRYDVALTDRWNIGPNPNGGYVLSVIAAALFDAADKPDPLSMTAHYLRPASPGAGVVEVEVFRVGRRHTHLQARLVQDTERVRVLAVFGDLDAASGLTLVRELPPDLPPPEQCQGRLRPADAPDGGFSSFMHRFETRLSPTSGLVRGEPTGVPEIAGWIRFADGRAPDVRSLPLVADAFPPPVFELGPAGWVPTIELTVHVRARPVDGWLKARFATHVLVDGYLAEDGELWDESGALVAQSRQLAMLLPPMQQEGS